MSSAEPGPGTPRARLTVVSGPSGVGKSSVLARVRELAPEVFYSVSLTTRAPRHGEVEGKHYHFVSAAEFRRLLADGELLEHAEYAGHCYGTPRSPVSRELAKGHPAILEIELQGARQVRAAMPHARLVMLVPPDWDTLVQRLHGRGTEDPVVVAARLATAKQELAAVDEFDSVVTNADVQAAAAQLVTLVTGR